MGLTVVAVLAAAVAVAVGRRRTERATERLVSELLAGAGYPGGDDRGGGDRAGDRVTAEDLADLPDPVRRYLETVLEEGRPRIRTVRLTQRGAFRLGEGAGAWKPMTAVQHVAVDPPGFVWDARIEAFPGVPVRVVDRYVAGEGSLRGVALSLVPVVDVPPGPGVNEAELLRYLAETVWFPTALLDDRVEWEPLDGNAARATVEDGGTTASVTFHFDERDLVERVHADGRYRQESDDEAPWTGHFRAYRERNGVLVPTEAEVGWDGDPEQYWRATVRSIEYGVGGPADERGSGHG